MTRWMGMRFALAALLLSSACGDESGDGSGGSGGGKGGGGSQGTSSETCSERTVDGSYVLAVSLQLANKRPVYFGASVTTNKGSMDLLLTPLATPFVDSGVTPFEPVGSAIALGPFSLDDDGGFTAAFPTILVPGAANPIATDDLELDVTLEGTACPGAGGSFCGTFSGEITKPIVLQLKSDRNFFAFNDPGVRFAYDCAGSDGSSTSATSSPASSVASSTSGGPSCDPAFCSGCDSICDEYGCVSCCYTCSGAACNQNCTF